MLKIDEITYRLPSGKEIWFHTVNRVWYCWECGRYSCEHVAEIERLKQTPGPAAAERAEGECYPAVDG